MHTRTCVRTPARAHIHSREEGEEKKRRKGRGRREGEIVREMSPLGETEGVGRERGERAE